MKPSIPLRLPIRLPALFVAAFLLAAFLGARGGTATASSAILEDEPAPDPIHCEDKCERKFHAWLERCEAAGGENCEARARKAFEDCVHNCERPPEPEDCESHCASYAREVEARCREAGGEGCGDKAEEAFRQCMERCDKAKDREPEPRPKPVPRDCELECRDYAVKVLTRCIDEGGGADCFDKSKQAYLDCLEDCPRDEDDVDRCARACREHANEILRRCKEDGGENCAERANEAYRSCLARECPKEETPVDPAPPSDCEYRCREQGNAVRDRCLEAGGGEDECHKRGVEAFENCVREHCKREGEEPKPDPKDCEEACEDYAHGVRNRCLEAGGGEEDCNRKFHEAFEDCVEERCDREPEPEPPSECEYACREHGNAVRDRCLEEGGGEDECHKRGVDAFEECLKNECKREPVEPKPDPEPEPRDCEELCREHARKVLNRCLEAGGGEEACVRESEEAFEDCIENECERSCEDKCEEEAGKVYRSCLEEGGDEETCRIRSGQFFENCLREHCDRIPEPEPEPPSDCEYACREHGNAVRDRCMEAGGNREACVREGNEAFETCLRTECYRDPEPEPEPEPVEPPKSCEDRCEEYAGGIYRRCIAEGGGEEECRERSGRAYYSCVEEECEPSCEDKCEAEAGKVFRDCIAEGGGEEACRQRSNRFFENCLRERCDREPEPEPVDPPESCEGACEQRAKVARDACQERGGSEGECHRAFRLAFIDCLEAACEPNCHNRCEITAERAFWACIDDEGGEDVCHARQRQVYEDCVEENCDRAEPRDPEPEPLPVPVLPIAPIAR